MLAVQYTGDGQAVLPTLGLTFQPDESKELDDAVATTLLEGGGPFKRVALKVAREQAQAAAPVVDTTTTPEATPPAQQEGS